MKHYICILTLVVLAQTLSGKVYRTEPISSRIKSLQVSLVDDWQGLPIIELGGDKFVEIKFDEMSHEYKHLTYSIVHCDADWTPSNLTPIEYIQGFQNMPVDDYLFSFATTTAYTNYRLVLPNEDVQFKVSGNYAVEVVDTESRQVLLSACFSVTESPNIPISAQITTNTDIDFNRAHQQLSFSLNCNAYKISSPQQELKVFVMQNNRRDNRVGSLQPTSILNGIYTYQHNRQLIFEAGNEYRRFEITTTAYKPMGVDNISFHSPYYHIDLMKDIFRAPRAYIYDEDHNGRYWVRSVQGTNHDTESDYFFVHFFLETPQPLLGRVYIQSEAFNNILDAGSEMQYSHEEGGYTKSTRLKQGAYNYMYLLQAGKNAPGSTAAIEGNFHQTRNEYTILVYHRPFGERFDRLIGSKTVMNQ